MTKSATKSASFLLYSFSYSVRATRTDLSWTCRGLCRNRLDILIWSEIPKLFRVILVLCFASATFMVRVRNFYRNLKFQWKSAQWNWDFGVRRLSHWLKITYLLVQVYESLWGCVGDGWATAGCHLRMFTCVYTASVRRQHHADGLTLLLLDVWYLWSVAWGTKCNSPLNFSLSRNYWIVLLSEIFLFKNAKSNLKNPGTIYGQSWNFEQPFSDRKIQNLGKESSLIL